MTSRLRSAEQGSRSSDSRGIGNLSGGTDPQCDIQNNIPRETLLLGCTHVIDSSKSTMVPCNQLCNMSVIGAVEKPRPLLFPFPRSNSFHPAAWLRNVVRIIYSSTQRPADRIGVAKSAVPCPSSKSLCTLPNLPTIFSTTRFDLTKPTEIHFFLPLNRKDVGR